MKYLICFIISYTIFSFATVAEGQDIFAGYENLFTTPAQYVAYQTSDPIKIDGNLNEPCWENAPWSAYFTDIEGNKKPAPAFKTRFKLLWDTQYIFIAAELEEPDIWANLTEHDAIVFYDNDFEIFIDPDGDTHNYFEIEVNPLNTIFDLFLPKPYRNGGPAVYNWDVQNLRSAVSFTGTINNPKDRDKKWYVEMAIPFQSLNLGSNLSKNYADWRINFSRVEWDTEIKNGAYKKKTDTITHRPVEEHNWVWSQQGLINMHFPERWGYLHFSTEKTGAQKVDLLLPVAEQVKKYLWLLYYKQQDYRRQQHQYAKELAQLNFPASIDVAGLHCIIALEATGSQFKATVKSEGGKENWQIDHEGKISQILHP